MPATIKAVPQVTKPAIVVSSVWAVVAAIACAAMLGCDRPDNEMGGREAWPVDDLQNAANNRDAEAQFELGKKYFRGVGVASDKEAGFQLIREAAQSGLVGAQLLLSSLHGMGEGTAKNEKEAVAWLQKAANQGNVKAQSLLGQMYLAGGPVEKDEQRGRELLEKAAAKNDGDALVALAKCYSEGVGVTKNSDKWGELMWRAVEVGNPEALAAFGILGLNGWAKDKGIDERKAIAMLVEAASKGNETAENALADYFLTSLYTNDFRPPENASQAFTWIKQKAEQGDGDAQYRLALCYLRGEGTEVDAHEGIRWLDMAAKARVPEANIYGFPRPWIRNAAENGNATAQYRIGVHQLILEDDSLDEAEVWLTKAAEQGHTLAQKYLYHLYSGLIGGAADVKKNPAEAIRWLRAAAESGGVEEKGDLGMAYLRGEAGEENRAEGVPLLRTAAEGGVAMAQAELAEIYIKGELATKDELEAYKWALLAAASQGISANWAKALVKSLESRLSRFEIAEGQRKAAKFTTAARQAPSAGGEGSAGSASGFLVTRNGHIVTNAHVVEGGGNVLVVYRGERLKAEVIKVDSSTDLALLKVEAVTDALPVTSSRGVDMGDMVATVGFPNPVLQGREPKFASGEIAALSGGQDDPKFFQVSVPLQPGNSGGPLTDSAGNVIGVVSAKLNPIAAIATTGTVPENVNYAVKGSYLLGFLEASPEVQKGMLEAREKPLNTKELAGELTKAAVLVEIEPNIPAEAVEEES
jgi:TPR repeat protein